MSVPFKSAYQAHCSGHAAEGRAGARLAGERLWRTKKTSYNIQRIFFLESNQIHWLVYTLFSLVYLHHVSASTKPPSGTQTHTHAHTNKHTHTHAYINTHTHKGICRWAHNCILKYPTCIFPYRILRDHRLLYSSVIRHNWQCPRMYSIKFTVKTCKIITMICWLFHLVAGSVPSYADIGVHL